MYGLEIFYQCGKRVKTKRRKLLRVNSNFQRSYREKAGRDGSIVLVKLLFLHYLNCHTEI